MPGPSKNVREYAGRGVDASEGSLHGKQLECKQPVSSCKQEEFLENGGVLDGEQFVKAMMRLGTRLMREILSGICGCPLLLCMAWRKQKE